MFLHRNSIKSHFRNVVLVVKWLPKISKNNNSGRNSSPLLLIRTLLTGGVQSLNRYNGFDSFHGRMDWPRTEQWNVTTYLYRIEGDIVIGGFRGQGEEDVEEEQMERKIDQPVRPIKFITRSDWLVDRFDGCNGMDGIIYVGQTEWVSGPQRSERGFNNHEWTIIIKCANLNTSPGCGPPPDQTRWGDKGRGSGWSGSICLICWLGYLEPHFRGAGGGSDCCSISNEPEWARKSLSHIIQKHRRTIILRRNG